MQQMFYAWHNSDICWVNKPVWKKNNSVKHPLNVTFISFCKSSLLAIHKFFSFQFSCILLTVNKTLSWRRYLGWKEVKYCGPHCDKAACGCTEEAGKGLGGHRLGRGEEQRLQEEKEVTISRLRPLVDLRIRIKGWEFGVSCFVGTYLSVK